jgi:hypothetical protein
LALPATVTDCPNGAALAVFDATSVTDVHAADS